LRQTSSQSRPRDAAKRARGTPADSMNHTASSQHRVSQHVRMQ
jgi:hypothetical protein